MESGVVELDIQVGATGEIWSVGEVNGPHWTLTKANKAEEQVSKQRGLALRISLPSKVGSGGQHKNVN